MSILIKIILCMILSVWLMKLIIRKSQHSVAPDVLGNVMNIDVLKFCCVHFFAKLISSNSKSSSYCFDKYFTIPKSLFSSYYLLFSLLPMKAIYEASKRNHGMVISFQYIHKGLEWIKNIRCRNCACSVYRWF